MLHVIAEQKKRKLMKDQILCIQKEGKNVKEKKSLFVPYRK